MAKNVCIIITGGTVLHKQTNDLVSIQTQADIPEWRLSIPELTLMAEEIEFFLFHSGVDADLNPSVWQKTAQFIFENKDAYSGFVILSSVANIPYFSRALFLMIKNPSLPIIFTGSQLPDYLLQDRTGLSELLEESKDVGLRANIVNSLQVVRSNIKGIYVMFGDKLISGYDISLKQVLMEIPFNYTNSQVVGSVEFSIKLKPQYEKYFKTQKTDMELRGHLETNIVYLDINPVTTAEDILSKVGGKAGIVAHISPTLGLPASLYNYLASQGFSIPVVCFGESFILPQQKNRKELLNNFRRKNIFIIEGKSRAYILPTFMWAIGKTKQSEELAKLLS